MAIVGPFWKNNWILAASNFCSNGWLPNLFNFFPLPFNPYTHIIGIRYPLFFLPLVCLTVPVGYWIEFDQCNAIHTRDWKWKISMQVRYFSFSSFKDGIWDKWFVFIHGPQSWRCKDRSCVVGSKTKLENPNEVASLPVINVGILSHFEHWCREMSASLYSTPSERKIRQLWSFSFLFSQTH